MTHTPGPWRWENEGYYSGLKGPNGEWICDDGSAGGEYGQQIDPDSADGKLIAAAPDLLAACIDARDALHSLGSTSTDHYHADEIAALDAAIAKATATP